jgi:outer membrane protein W
MYGSGKVRGIGKDWYYVYYKSKRMGSVVTGFIDASKVELLEPQKNTDTEQEKALEETGDIKFIEKKKIEDEKFEITEMEQTASKEPKENKVKAKKPKTQQIIKPLSGIGIFVSYAMLSESDYGSGLAFGVNLQLGITKNIAVELTGLRYQSNTEQSPTGLSEGALSLLPLQFSIQARFPFSNQVTPYIKGGVGYSMNNFKIKNEVATQWNDLGYYIRETVENSFEFHFGAGVDFLVHKNIALNGDIKYLISNAKGTWAFTNQIIDTANSGNLNDLKLNTITIGFGLKYLF